MTIPQSVAEILKEHVTLEVEGIDSRLTGTTFCYRTRPRGSLHLRPCNLSCTRLPWHHGRQK